ncbi:MAG: FG-GAP repeat domain-containing protein [Acidobacteriaceae bacterium]
MRINARLLSPLALALLLPGACLHSQTTATASGFKFSAPHVVPLKASAVQYFASGDVNGDGNTDLLVNVNAPEALLGDGKGGFIETSVNLPSVGPPDVLTNLLLDVNGDGYADLITIDAGSFDHDCNIYAYGSLNVYLGDGKGNFKAGYSTQYNPIYTSSIDVGDFNHDGKPDLAVLTNGNGECGASSNVIVTYLNNGHDGFTGVFGADITNLGDAADNLTAGDFNGDGHLDLAYTIDSNTSTNGQREISTLDGNGDGSLRGGPSYAIEGGAYQIAAGDLNGDKRADLVVNAGARNAPGAQPKIVSLLAKVAGGFYWHSALSYSQRLYPGFQLLDLNGDGKLDLLLPFVSSGTPALITSKLSAGDGTGTFQTPQTLLSQTTYYGPIALPLKKNGLPAIILFSAPGSKTASLEVLLNESK